jgi:hypothetical protein
MPDIGIATIETCLRALEELPHEDAMAAIGYITQRLHIKENKRRAFEAQKAKLGREPTDEEVSSTLDEWDEAVAGDPSMAASSMPPTTPAPGVLGMPTPIHKRAM